MKDKTEKLIKILVDMAVETGENEINAYNAVISYFAFEGDEDTWEITDEEFQCALDDTKEWISSKY